MKKIKINCFGGKFGFVMRKKFPNICSYAYFTLKRKLANKNGREFNSIVLNKESVYPTIVSIETINKCNGTCSFCGCNKNDDKRNFKIMDDSLLEKIINDLKEHDFDGLLMLVMNGEPFMDKKIIERLEFAKNNLPNATMKLITNGSIISKEQFSYINEKHLLDELVINNYNTTMDLNSNIKNLYDEFKDKDLSFDVHIDIRYSGEVLSNRANSSPNKKGQKDIKDVCTLPFTDFNVNPYGIATICCCDATEQTNLGDVNKQSISEIFNGEKYKKIRELMKNNRSNYRFCKYCDFIDSGMRQKMIKEYLKEEK